MKLGGHADFFNLVAYDAACCLQCLLQHNEDPSTYRAEYDALKGHPCRLIRDIAQRWLAKFFEADHPRGPEPNRGKASRDLAFT